MQVSQSGRGAGAARRAVDGTLTIEDCVAAIGAFSFWLVGPQDVADAANGRIQRMDRFIDGLDQFADGAAELDQARGAQVVETGIGALRFDDGVVVAAVGHINRQPAEAWHVDLDAGLGQVGRYISDLDRRHPAGSGGIIDVDDTGRYFQLELAGRARADQAVFQAERYHADRAVAAHRQATRGLDEQDAGVAVFTRWGIQETARHHVMAAGLVAQARADPVEACQEILSPLRHRCACQQRCPAGHQAHGIACGMAVDRKEGMPHEHFLKSVTHFSNQESAMSKKYSK